MRGNDSERDDAIGPVIIAYDGSELAAFAIEQSGQQLSRDRQALVVCVWQPVDVGFTPVSSRHFDADQAGEVRAAAEETASHGIYLAKRAGFRPEPIVVESAPTWKGIVGTAEKRRASLIVIGSHRHKGLLGHLVGSVAAAVIANAPCPVLVVRTAQ